MAAVELGRFIAFEGGEGAGKSTQARLLADALTARGIATVLTREPGGTPGAEAIRPALAAGKWVVCDRFLDSSRAYQGAAGDLGDDAMRALHRVGSKDLLPNLTIVLTAAAERVDARLAQRDGQRQDAIGGRDAAYHARVAAAFNSFVRSEPQRFAGVDGDGSVRDVHARVLSAIEPLLQSVRTC